MAKCYEMIRIHGWWGQKALKSGFCSHFSALLITQTSHTWSPLPSHTSGAGCWSRAHPASVWNQYFLCASSMMVWGPHVGGPTAPFCRRPQTSGGSTGSSALCSAITYMGWGCAEEGSLGGGDIHILISDSGFVQQKHNIATQLSSN